MKFEKWKVAGKKATPVNPFEPGLHLGHGNVKDTFDKLYKDYILDTDLSDDTYNVEDVEEVWQYWDNNQWVSLPKTSEWYFGGFESYKEYAIKLFKTDARKALVLKQSVKEEPIKPETVEEANLSLEKQAEMYATWCQLDNVTDDQLFVSEMDVYLSVVKWQQKQNWQASQSDLISKAKVIEAIETYWNNLHSWQDANPQHLINLIKEL